MFELVLILGLALALLALVLGLVFEFVGNILEGVMLVSFVDVEAWDVVREVVVSIGVVILSSLRRLSLVDYCFYWELDYGSCRVLIEGPD